MSVSRFPHVPAGAIRVPPETKDMGVGKMTREQLNRGVDVAWAVVWAGAIVGFAGIVGNVLPVAFIGAGVATVSCVIEICFAIAWYRTLGRGEKK